MDGTLREGSASSAMLKYFESVFGARLAVGCGRWADEGRVSRETRRSVRRVCGVDRRRWTTAPNNRSERSRKEPIRCAPPQIMRARSGPALPQSLLEEINGQAGAYRVLPL